jgi:hypothetical protein
VIRSVIGRSPIARALFALEKCILVQKSDLRSTNCGSAICSGRYTWKGKGSLHPGPLVYSSRCTNRAMTQDLKSGRLISLHFQLCWRCVQGCSDIILFVLLKIRVTVNRKAIVMCHYRRVCSRMERNSLAEVTLPNRPWLATLEQKHDRTCTYTP